MFTYNHPQFPANPALPQLLRRPTRYTGVIRRFHLAAIRNH